MSAKGFALLIALSLVIGGLLFAGAAKRSSADEPDLATSEKWLTNVLGTPGGVPGRQAWQNTSTFSERNETYTFDADGCKLTVLQGEWENFDPTRKSEYLPDIDETWVVFTPQPGMYFASREMNHDERLQEKTAHPPTYKGSAFTGKVITVNLADVSLSSFNVYHLRGWMPSRTDRSGVRLNFGINEALAYRVEVALMRVAKLCGATELASLF